MGIPVRLDQDDGLIHRYLEGDLNDADKERLESLLSEASFCRRLAEHALDTAALYELGREGLLAPATRGGRTGAGPRRTLGLSFWIRLAAAIFVVVSVALWFAFKWIAPISSAPVACWVSDVSGSVSMASGDTVSDTDRAMSLHPHAPIRMGEWIRVEGFGSYVQLAMSDGTQIVLTDRAVARIWKTEPQKQIFLERGHLSADVQQQIEGRPLIISTPEADAEVLGTRLSISAESGETRLGVFTGRVQMRRHSDGRAIRVETGQQAVASRHTELVASPMSATPDTWSEDFEAGLPAQWRCGQWVTEGLPPGSAGGVLAEARFFGKPREDNYHCVTTYKDWTGGLFRIHEETVLHVTYKLERPGWFHIMMGVRSDREKQFHVGNYETQDGSLWKIPAGQWRTVQMPLQIFTKASNDGKPMEGAVPPAPGDVVYMLFFNSLTQDLGLVVDRIWVTRGEESAH
jgi:hypothetical protein